jgi:hypothetical protein
VLIFPEFRQPFSQIGVTIIAYDLRIDGQKRHIYSPD